MNCTTDRTLHLQSVHCQLREGGYNDGSKSLVFLEFTFRSQKNQIIRYFTCQTNSDILLYALVVGESFFIKIFASVMKRDLLS